MPPRPYLTSSIVELESEFARRGDDPAFLEELIHELDHRATARAERLRDSAARRLAEIRRASTQKPAPPLGGTGTRSRPEPAPPPPRRAGPPPQAPRVTRTAGPVSPAPRPAASRITNEPEAILDAWTALEVLSPSNTFQRPEKLAGGDRQAVAKLDGARLPWEGGGESGRPRQKLYYQVVLGTVDLEATIPRLLARYSDSRAERPSARGEAILAVAVVDRDGRPVDGGGTVVSSFGWGVPRALAGDLGSLAAWRDVEHPLAEALGEQLRRTDDEGEVLPLDRAHLAATFEWLVATLGIPRDLVAAPRFAIRSYEYYLSPDPPEPLLLNSFFLGDLAAARELFANGRSTTNLRRYLGRDAPRTRRDLLHDTAALEAAVAPERIPPARWPGPGRHPLVLLQQAAVNLALHELEDTGILAVNGPPGTGKTTLLRDLVAALVTERAEAMAAFDDPASAFTSSGQKIRAGQAWLHLYRLDARLRGFEMLVVSSNNKAVENVSAELPGRKAVAEDADDLRYFDVLSDALRQGEGETWGLVAAVLGNAANRGRFKQTFWWNPEVGLSTYLAAAAGTPQQVQGTNPTSGQPESRPPRIVTAADAPRGHDDALRRWRKARSDFRQALARSRKELAELEKIRGLAMEIPALAAAEASASRTAASARDAEARAAARAADATGRLAEAEEALRGAQRRLDQHARERPGFFARLFRTRPARVWATYRASLARAQAGAKQAHAEASRGAVAAEQESRAAATAVDAAHRALAAAEARHLDALGNVAVARGRLGGRFVDAEFFGRAHADVHVTSPWLDADAQRLRDDVFAAAMRLHKAFIDAAARPLRHNLGALMTAFGGRPFPSPEKQALLPDLWSSFFLAVPVVSSTFASVERMLGGLPPESLGWLLVDEAGQALPQATVGALMRTRRAVVVGDPLQIEPVVTLPDTLTQAICRHFGADPDRFNAPAASAQTLADAATPYFAEFESRFGSRTVGVPLLVHRRCAEPMFGVSNQVAYGGLMVNAKTPKPSRIGDVLGPSTWIDVQGSAEEKWCPEEGEVVLRLLRALEAAGVSPDLYIVTPFVVVADSLRRIVRASGIVERWGENPWRWTEDRIGTVHTVQGREAEAVVFVLGAPQPQQTGARNWAGGVPNLLNVAVTRAKERLYVVGNRRLWREAGLFGELHARLPAP